MNIIIEIIKGIIIGLANIIPGVSGGTMAVTMGVYDKIILAVNNIRKNFLGSFKVLIPYIIGAVLGIGGLSFVVKFALDKYAIQTSFLFVGLIIGGIPLIFNKTKGDESKTNKIILFLMFFTLIASMAFLKGDDKSVIDISINLYTIIQLFFVGTIASATMIIPGVSGSLVMMILGFYGIIVSNISNFIRGILQLDFQILFHTVSVLIPFAIGILVGIGVISKIIEILFKKIPQLTYSAILGLIVGSPIPIIEKLIGLDVTTSVVIVSILTFTIGFMVAYKLGQD